MTDNLEAFARWTASARTRWVDGETDDQSRSTGWYIEYSDGSWIQLQDGGIYWSLIGNTDNSSLDLPEVEEWLWEGHARLNIRTLADRTAEQRAARKR
jgi:hypothetical protein